LLRCTLGSRGRKGEGGCYLWFLLEEGAHLRRGAHHTFVGGYLERRELLQGQGKGKQGFKGQARARLKQRQTEKGQRQAKEGRHTKAKGALLQEASREVFKELQGIREGLLLYQVHLYMFSVLYILL
jgi:hypothetical protein